ncbi:MAG: ABC transporter ATP-binding protein [Alphaproteobacteria bacterium]|nr:ABC transporter ATP-binding protein [Alphaproteobacteria bacterium]
MEPLIRIDRLTKLFGPIEAVRDVSFSVDRGEVVGLLGPNGAGKSTTLKLLAGYLAPTSGSASVCGHDVVASPLAARRSLGYLPEGAPLYDEMTPSGFLDFVARVRRLDGRARRDAVAAAARRLQLDGVLRQPIGTLSKGFRRRVGLAQAILLDPEVLVLDEPTDGLDPTQKHEVRALLREMAGRKAVIVSTHNLDEVEAVCTRAVVIAAGRVVADGAPAALATRSARHNVICIRVAREHAASAMDAIGTVPGLVAVDRPAATGDDTEIRVMAGGDADLRAPLHRALVDREVAVLEFWREPGRMEDVFRQLTRQVGEVV